MSYSVELLYPEDYIDYLFYGFLHWFGSTTITKTWLFNFNLSIYISFLKQTQHSFCFVTLCGFIFLYTHTELKKPNLPLASMFEGASVFYSLNVGLRSIWFLSLFFHSPFASSDCANSFRLETHSWTLNSGELLDGMKWGCKWPVWA